MPGPRDEITRRLSRLRARTGKDHATSSELDETLVAADTRDGRRYGNYRIIRRLGAGGMGHVYLAIDVHLGRYAALKFLSPQLESDPEMLARLKQEARTASSLNHPNILTIYDISEADGESFIASEFIEGATLRQALERRAIEPAAALDIAIQIVAALCQAHAAHIVHRDLKPANIMLRRDGLVKVIDFGLANLDPGNPFSHAALPALAAGTLQYMSPEQARGEALDARADLWSLGAILYEMLTGRRLFSGESENTILASLLEDQPPNIDDADIPAGLLAVITKALEKQRQRRYQTAQLMLDDLKALSVSTQARSSSLLRTHAADSKFRRKMIVAVFVCVAAGTLAAWWWPLHGRDAVIGPAWFETSNYTRVTQRGDIALAAISPDGKYVAYTTPHNAQDQLHLLNLTTHRERQWPEFSGSALGLAFSPDSGTLYYTVHDQRDWGRLYSVQENSNEPMFVLDDVDGPVSFSPDGSKLAFRRRSDEKRTNREAVVIADARDTGNQTTILSKYNRPVGYRIAWSSGDLMATTLRKQGVDGESLSDLLVFTPEGKIVAEHSDPRLRLLSGPAWLDRGSTLIFTGWGRNVDAQAGLIELGLHGGQFRFFPSPVLTGSSVTVSGDFASVAAVTSARKSALWVAPIADLQSPVRWSADDSISSLTWLSDDAIVYPSLRGGNLALWKTSGNNSIPLQRGTDCLSHQPAAAGLESVVFSSNCGAAANASNLWSLNVHTGESSALTTHSNSDRGPAVTPDGRTVIYDSWPNNFPALWKLSATTHQKTQFTSLQARNASISPDGLHVACQIRENYDGQWRLAVLSINDGSIEKDNLPLPVRERASVRWSPAGTSLDYVVPQGNAEIWRYDLATAKPRPLLRVHTGTVSDFAWSPNGTQLAWVSSDVQQDVIIFHRRK